MSNTQYNGIMIGRVIVALLVVTTLAVQSWTPRVVPPLHLPAPQSVDTINGKIGVHTRLAGTADEQAIIDQLTAIREMGASYIVDLFPWAYVQPRGPRTYEWYGADLLVKHARRQGIAVVARLDIVPQWARPRQTSDRLILPQQYEQFGRYAAAFAARYRDDVRYIQIWNEPNLHFEWGGREPDPVAYATLLREVVPMMKAANPDVQIVAGNFSPGPSIPGIRTSDLEYLDAMLAANAPFDVLGVHAYGARAPADEEGHPDRVNFRRIEVYRDVLRASDAARPIIVTEGGWNDHPRWVSAATPAQRLRWTVDAYRMSMEWDDVIAVCFWQWQLPLTYSYQDNYSFVAADGRPKAVYYAVQAYARPHLRQGGVSN
jgi:polysaccharide biosynthesis protein PslG